MKHVIIGASGQVGTYLYQKLDQVGEDVIGTYYRHPHSGYVSLDMRDKEAVKSLLSAVKPDVVWIPAAMANVDFCEDNPELSYEQNVRAPEMVAELASKQGARLVFFSTDYVFDGMNGPYQEKDPVHPIQVYGQHKVEMEQYLLTHVPHSLIIRPAWIYSRDDNPRNFVYRVLSELRMGRSVKAVTDQWNTPTPSDGLVNMAWKALQDGFEGILHIVGPERLTRYELTQRIAKAFGYSPDFVEPVSTELFQLPAKRPLNGGLITQYSSYRLVAGRDFEPLF
ncbi:MAG: NAD(P)-dependent oxidoreductase [Sulfobacillus thermosulfidooxidans]|uniref:dTDP-4-dehydrorhamnose reductase n=1 Tax=Sulfobacillus thermosulfidooxidans TaxID=28034 RepID=A0A2T2X3B9_SULTH|nr:MAG: NAD(P)-dependent oxidoreductase [Sulfobacillus thermosulfidooxidans]